MGQEQSRKDRESSTTQHVQTEQYDIEEEDPEIIQRLQNYMDFERTSFVIKNHGNYFVDSKPHTSIEANLYRAVCIGESTVARRVDHDVIKSEIINRTGIPKYELDKKTEVESCQILSDTIPTKKWWDDMKFHMAKNNVVDSVQKYLQNRVINEEKLRLGFQFEDLEKSFKDAPQLDKEIFVYKTVKSDLKNRFAEAIRGKDRISDYHVYQTATWSPVFDEQDMEIPLVLKIRLPVGTSVLLLENLSDQFDFLIERYSFYEIENKTIRTNLYDPFTERYREVDLCQLLFTKDPSK